MSYSTELINIFSLKTLRGQPEEVMMAVHLFGGVSSPSFANFALKKTSEDNRSTFSPEAVHTLKHNFYVEDYMKSVATDESAICLERTRGASFQRWFPSHEMPFGFS